MIRPEVLEAFERPAPHAHYPTCGPACPRPLSPAEARLKAAAAARKGAPKRKRK